MILTWNERCEKFDAGEIVTNAKIQEVMQEEIDELRKELKKKELQLDFMFKQEIKSAVMIYNNAVGVPNPDGWELTTDASGEGVWKAYEEVHFNPNLIQRWIREGDEYVNRMTKEQMETLKKELALQKLSDIGQEIETLDTRSYLIGRYDGLRELTDEEIYAEMIKCIDEPEDGHTFRYKDFSRAILKKASEK